MPIDPVKIPQNVYIEDRIVGPLTLRQIIIMALGGGFSYVIYASLVKAYGRVDIATTIIVWTPAVIAAAFALIKVNDLSLSKIALLIAERMLKAPVRTWSPREGISINIKVLASQKNELEKKKYTTNQDKGQTDAHQKIQELSAVLDTSFIEEQNTPPPAPVQSTKAAAVQIEDEVADQATTLPVNPKRIKVDRANPQTRGPAVFHDIIPHHA